MKNVNYIVNGVLAVAVVILFFLHFSDQKESGEPVAFTSADGGVEGSMPIAYINLDSLIQNYNFAKDLLEIQVKKQENARANINQQMRNLQKEAEDFQHKLENNAFLTRERAEQEQQRLMRKREELQELDNRTVNDLMLEQQKNNEHLRDTVVSQLKEFNKDKGYQVILSNSGGDNVLWADKSYDISSEFIKYLNKKYSAPAK